MFKRGDRVCLQPFLRTEENTILINIYQEFTSPDNFHDMNVGETVRIGRHTFIGLGTGVFFVRPSRLIKIEKCPVCSKLL